MKWNETKRILYCVMYIRIFLSSLSVYLFSLFFRSLAARCFCVFISFFLCISIDFTSLGVLIVIILNCSSLIQFEYFAHYRSQHHTIEELREIKNYVVLALNTKKTHTKLFLIFDNSAATSIVVCILYRWWCWWWCVLCRCVAYVWVCECVDIFRFFFLL